MGYSQAFEVTMQWKRAEMVYIAAKLKDKAHYTTDEPSRPTQQKDVLHWLRDLTLEELLLVIDELEATNYETIQELQLQLTKSTTEYDIDRWDTIRQYLRRSPRHVDLRVARDERRKTKDRSVEQRLMDNNTSDNPAVPALYSSENHLTYAMAVHVLTLELGMPGRGRFDHTYYKEKFLNTASRLEADWISFKQRAWEWSVEEGRMTQQEFEEAVSRALKLSSRSHTGPTKSRANWLAAKQGILVKYFQQGSRVQLLD